LAATHREAAPPVSVDSANGYSDQSSPAILAAIQPQPKALPAYSRISENM
jgi:hypothetical protein